MKERKKERKKNDKKNGYKMVANIQKWLEYLS